MCLSRDGSVIYRSKPLISDRAGHGGERVVQLGMMYSDFASKEAAGRSPLYEKLCGCIAADTDLLSRLLELPLEKRQPNLLLAAVKYLFGVVEGWEQFRELTETHWAAIEDVILKRRTQTNEAARCATLLPLMALLPKPLALIEVGASAGLCLLPDYYSYDYNGQYVPPSQSSQGAPVFHCQVNDKTPIPAGNLEIMWRAGLDLCPLDLTNLEDVNWLQALIWPGEGNRGQLLDEAIGVARPVRPPIVQGDLRHDLEALASQAPREATLVVFHSAVLGYVPDKADRVAFGETVRRVGAQWISNEGADIFQQSDLPPQPWGRFSLALNGRTMAYTEAHGTEIEWLD
jgi:hypothetical protein